jgi:deferrochelatase/peroxidase EfeB
MTAQVLRRPYSYNDGTNFVTERWPPWRQGMEYDAGLFFVCYQRDPRTGFVKINERLSRFDMMNQFITHVGSGLFAIPHGAQKGEFIGRRLGLAPATSKKSSTWHQTTKLPFDASQSAGSWNR